MGAIRTRVCGALAASLLLSVLWVSAASAQCAASNSTPSLQPGGTSFGSSYAQWQGYFGAKVDGNGGTACNLNLTGTPTINGAPFLLFAGALPPLSFSLSGVMTLNYGSEFTTTSNALHLTPIAQYSVLGYVGGGTGTAHKIASGEAVSFTPEQTVVLKKLLIARFQGAPLIVSQVFPVIDPSAKPAEWGK